VADAQAVNARARRAVRAIVIDIGKQAPSIAGPTRGPEPGQSKEIAEDPFTQLAESGNILEPPFDQLTLAMFREMSSELGQCIEAMEVNIEGFGHRFVPRFRTTAPASVQAAAKLERVRLENFFAYVSMEDSFTKTRRKLRADMESTGNGYLEIIRNAVGEIQGINHLPAYQMRLGRLEDNAIKIEVPILHLTVEGQVEVKRIVTWRRFRRYVQSNVCHGPGLTFSSGYQLRWFKSYSDPRVYDNDTGELVRQDDVAQLPEARRANEVVHFRIYSPRTPYGLPRYIGNLLSVLGDRASEEINYNTFRCNNIPSMMLMVSNGQLTEGTINRIKDFVESQIQGSDNYSKFLIVEAEGVEEGEDGGQVKIEAKPLTEAQHDDALFQKYSGNNQDKIRRAFRLPPILVGRSSDYTRSTADTSRKLADEQIFAPERGEFDDWINRRLFAEMEILYHKFRSNTPNTTDNAELVKILGGAEKTGGMTPRIARMMLEDILGQELPEFPSAFEEKADMPFSLLMADAVKNKAQPNEPGQQVTALKALETIEKLTGAEELSADQEDELVHSLMQASRYFEERWRAEAQR
jgi:capsid portal protein